MLLEIIHYNCRRDVSPVEQCKLYWSHFYFSQVVFFFFFRDEESVVLFDVIDVLGGKKEKKKEKVHISVLSWALHLF